MSDKDQTSSGQSDRPDAGRGGPPRDQPDKAGQKGQPGTPSSHPEKSTGQK